MGGGWGTGSSTRRSARRRSGEWDVLRVNQAPVVERQAQRDARGNGDGAVHRVGRGPGCPRVLAEGPGKEVDLPGLSDQGELPGVVRDGTAVRGRVKAPLLPRRAPLAVGLSKCLGVRRDDPRIRVARASLAFSARRGWLGTSDKEPSEHADGVADVDAIGAGGQQTQIVLCQPQVLFGRGAALWLALQLTLSFFLQPRPLPENAIRPGQRRVSLAMGTHPGWGALLCLLAAINALLPALRVGTGWPFYLVSLCLAFVGESIARRQFYLSYWRFGI